VVAPPPLVYLGFLVLGLGLGYQWPLATVGDHVPTVARIGAGAVLVALLRARPGWNIDTDCGPNFVVPSFVRTRFG
jgi:hypothetical protein